MKRRLFNLAAAVSLAACVAIAGLVVRSDRVNEAIARSTYASSWYVMLSKGRCLIQWHTPRMPIDHDFVNWQHWRSEAARIGGLDRSKTYMRHVDLRVAEIQWGTQPDGSYQRIIVLSGWWFVLAAALVPSMWLRWWLRRDRHLKGHCRFCGYDLRATPQEGGALLDRCPECGKPVGDVAIAV